MKDVKLNKKQMDMIRNAYDNLDLDYCLDNAMLVLCCEAVSIKNVPALYLMDAINNALLDLDAQEQARRFWNE